MLSTPVCGVESRNAAAAAQLAPCRRMEATTGITLHEQSGSGIPSKVAFTTGPMPFPPRCRSVHSGEIQIDNKPANANPNNKYGAISRTTSQDCDTKLEKSSGIESFQAIDATARFVPGGSDSHNYIGIGVDERFPDLRFATEGVPLRENKVGEGWAKGVSGPALVRELAVRPSNLVVMRGSTKGRSE